MGFRIRHYPHNDFIALSHHHREVINAKVESGKLEGVSLDCMSFLIALAFRVEAFVNFVGCKKIEGWNERAAYSRKMKALSEKFHLSFEASQEPHKTLALLKEVRDQMAHGKPREFVRPAASRSEMRKAMSPLWGDHLEPEFVNHSYAQVKNFEAMLLKAARIKAGATLTSAFGGWAKT